MASKNPDQWSEIVPSTHPGLDNIRRVSPEHPLDFRRGKDFHNRYLFSLIGLADINSFTQLPNIAGIDVAVRDVGHGSCQLVLTLLDQDDVDVFKALVADLISATSLLVPGDNARGIIMVLERLGSWQSLLARRRDNLLSLSARIGLFGELLFLRDRLLSVLPALKAVATWRGPYGDEQDFAVGNIIFEIKTQIVTTDRRLQISSEDQLDTTSGEILIVHQTIAESGVGSATALSLNSLIYSLGESIRSGSVDAFDLFQLGLIKVGYVSRAEYDNNNWILSERVCFQVTDDFPRIVPSMLAPGIDHVRYQIRQDALKPFEMDLNAEMNRALYGT